MRIAIIGTGISGLTSAYLLSQDHEVVVYEANSYIGGHTNTLDVSFNGQQYAVDTGFIVFNEKTYPNFVKLMKRLGVGWQDSVMSFSVQCEKTGLEFSPSTLNSLFIQRRNLLRPSFYRMLWDVMRFKRDSEALLESNDYKLTLAAFLSDKGYSQAFVQHFIIPMGEAVWSADPVKFNGFDRIHQPDGFTHGNNEMLHKCLRIPFYRIEMQPASVCNHLIPDAFPRIPFLNRITSQSIRIKGRPQQVAPLNEKGVKRAGTETVFAQAHCTLKLMTESCQAHAQRFRRLFTKFG